MRLACERAMALGWMPDGVNPAATSRLRRTLPRPTAVRAVKHMPSLPWPSVPDFWRDLALRDGMGAEASRLIILTGTRHSEAVGARWDEIDLAAGLWVVPADRTKQRKPQPIPIVPAMREILDRMKAVRRAASPFVFHGVDPRRPMSVEHPVGDDRPDRRAVGRDGRPAWIQAIVAVYGARIMAWRRRSPRRCWAMPRIRWSRPISAPT